MVNLQLSCEGARQLGLEGHVCELQLLLRGFEKVQVNYFMTAETVRLAVYKFESG